jgi:PAS domain S-box-containing protein
MATMPPADELAETRAQLAEATGRLAEVTAQLAETRAQLAEATETIEAIRGGGVDSLVIGPPGQEQIYSLASADRTYRRLVQTMNEGAAAVSPRGLILEANPRLADMAGRPASALVGTPVGALATTGSQGPMAELLGLGAGDSHQGEIELAGPDGPVPVLLAVSAFGLDGMLVRCLIFTDLTAQRAAEQEARRAGIAQRESEARLRAVFDNAPAGIYDLTADGDFVRANPRFCEITGYTAAELAALPLYAIIHPDDVPMDEAQNRRMLAGEIGSYTVIKRYLRKGGGVVWAEVNRALVRAPDGRPLLIVGVVRDITAQRDAEAQVRALTTELEDRVRQRTAQLERANQNLEAFTYSVSHDLRAPLRALNGFSEALAEEYADRLDETGLGYLQHIEAASGRMARLIDDLLHLSRVARAEIRLEPADLSAEVAEIVAELRARDPGRPVSVRIQPGVTAVADRGLIRTVLQNLMENAWKFTGRRDDATIEFGTVPPGPDPAADGLVCCYLRDNGAGFDPAFASHLFQPFQRLHTDSDFPGTGIGLASARQIVERHGGRIWAEGAEGHGATFYFTLGTVAAAR